VVRSTNIPSRAIASKKRIRDVTSSITSAPEYQSQPNVNATRPMLSRRSSIAATQTSDVQSTFGRNLDKTEQTRVTPSPHLTPPPNKFIIHTPLTNTEMSHIPSGSATTNFEHHTVMGNYLTYHQEPRPSQQDSTITFHGTTHCQGKVNMQQSQLDSWKRLKHQQQKSQQRAFVRHSDNPFKSYKHDPNDAESYLDQLVSSSNQTTPTSASIIPPEGFRAIDTVRSQPHFFSRQAINSMYEANSRGTMTRRKHLQGQVVSIRDVLSQKAAESNVLNMRTTRNTSNVLHPWYPCEQFTYSQCNGLLPVRSVHGGASPSFNFIENAHGTYFSPNNHTMLGHAMDNNQYNNRHTIMYPAGRTNMPESSTYVHSLNEGEQPDLQYFTRDVSATDLLTNRDATNVDQLNLEHTFF
jgi:hypothetical protein